MKNQLGFVELFTRIRIKPKNYKTKGMKLKGKQKNTASIYEALKKKDFF